MVRRGSAVGKPGAGKSPINPNSTTTNRAHAGKARIKSRLIANLDPDEWDLRPKPKWMRWVTYNRHVHRYDRYEEILDYRCVTLAAKL